MNIKQIEYFIDLSTSLSFTKTAQHFYISQTAITKQIHNLEDELGIPLFIRDKKKVEITPEGTLFLTHAKSIMKEIDIAYQVIDAYKRGESGIIHIGFLKNSDEKLIVGLLETIKKAYPSIILEYRAYRRIELIQLFNERELDLIIMMQNNALKGPSLLLKTYPLVKYYHKDTSLESLPLLYDTSTEYENMDTEIEQTLLKACMKEGYVILQKFMDQSPYCKYLSSSPTNKTSSLYLYYHEDAHQIIRNIIQKFKKHA
ncbi:LysR family transcriptional regulator [uncultured Catenibacterium sp.]|uniref:LysR family transcriptional regulator n=1 Tax=uncultured Catenibacterium sp. TaxID=286142 RepID=UPI0025F868CF|nr:LysR family transcriptional regulator [uncultured Catenibacterium sp.]